MASAYGRGGTQTGGKGGTSLSSAYSFGAKDAGSYLSGGLADQYAAAQGTMQKDLPTKVGGGKASRRVELQLLKKKGAKENIGKLRDIASATAVGDFLGYASTKGRGSEAHAPKGLITGEAYAGGGVGVQAQTEGKLGDWWKHQKRIKRGLGLSKFTSQEDTQAALQKRTSADYKPGGALSYAGAMGGDPRGQLHGAFNRLRSGESSVEQEYGFQPGRKEQQRRGISALFGGGNAQPQSPGRVADPAAVLYGGESAYQKNNYGR